MNQIDIENLFVMDIETVSEKEHFHLLDKEWQDLWAQKIIKKPATRNNPRRILPATRGNPG